MFMCAAQATTNEGAVSMMTHTTLEQLRQLKLLGMAQALQDQIEHAASSAMGFEERLALLVDREVHGRQDRRLARLLKAARLKYPQAMIEDLDARASRGLDRAMVMSLSLGPWVRGGHAVLITGPTGAGKSWLACALAQHALRQGHSAFYQRVPRLAEELRIRHANGTFTQWLETLKNTDVLLLDDWGMVGVDAHTRSDLLEIIDDRAGRRATVITSQLPIEHWHEWIGDATVADAMLDRIMQNHHRLTLVGESLRKSKSSSKPKEQNTA
jgi:DNA replication protein DnaC